MIEMVVDSIRINALLPQRVVVLKELKRERYLMIVIGIPEADAIAIKLQNHEVPRPLTHDLLSTTITELSGRVTHVLINDLVGETYYARIILDVDGRHVELDARPSDALALAVRAEVPVYVAETVLDTAGIEPEERDEAEAQEKPRIAADDERLNVFRDFIEDLDLDDLGKSGS